MDARDVKDPKDTWANGLIAGLTAPIIFYFILEVISYMVAARIEDFDGFSLNFLCVTALLGNIIPLQVFNRQERGYAMYGVVTMTFILMFGIIYYFKSIFFP